MPSPPRQTMNAFWGIAPYGFQSVRTCSTRAPTTPRSTAAMAIGTTRSGSRPRRANPRRAIHTPAAMATTRIRPYQRGWKLPSLKTYGSPGLGSDRSTGRAAYRPDRAASFHSTLDKLHFLRYHWSMAATRRRGRPPTPSAARPPDDRHPRAPPAPRADPRGADERPRRPARALRALRDGAGGRHGAGRPRLDAPARRRRAALGRAGRAGRPGRAGRRRPLRLAPHPLVPGGAAARRRRRPLPAADPAVARHGRRQGAGGPGAQGAGRRSRGPGRRRARVHRLLDEGRIRPHRDRLEPGGVLRPVGPAHAAARPRPALGRLRPRPRPGAAGDDARSRRRLGAGR